MSVLKHNLTYFISSKNSVTRLLAFGILAPLTLYLIQPSTLPMDQWPYLLMLFWGFCLVSILPMLWGTLSIKRRNVIEHILTDLESGVAGIWASAFGFDVLTLWSIFAAGIFNQVGLHGPLGLLRISCVDP